ncbi:hypothetical protein IJ00_13460 [Calothrix sp. 336/3]|nr:hypothetical protein IJ00_13460 [Calothrix sp. 336/3]
MKCLQTLYQLLARFDTIAIPNANEMKKAANDLVFEIGVYLSDVRELVFDSHGKYSNLIIGI